MRGRSLAKKINKVIQQNRTKQHGICNYRQSDKIFVFEKQKQKQAKSPEQGCKALLLTSPADHPQ